MATNDTPEIPGLFDDLPEEAPQEQIAKISLRSWRTHLASIRALDKRIEKLIDEAVKQALAQGRKLTVADIGRVFQRHPELRTALDKTMQQLNDDLTATIEQGSKDAWLRANTAADAVVAAMANNNAQLAVLLNAGTNKPQNDRALQAFQQREMQGLKLSDRVWRATEGMKLDMERAIEVALAEGVPAQKLSERVRELLKEPHRLYRRVRDKRTGVLKLSQAAQKYHPGTGTYRSSYKNAMRVARTEVNMAYQASDSERWARSWWVKGIRVSLSNNHTSLDRKGRPAPLVDICDLLAGDYPADFKFTGWHPQCRCFATAITCEYSDIRDYYRRRRAGEDLTGYTAPGTITEPPAQFKDWLSANSERLAAASARGTIPYFIANNTKYSDPKWKPSEVSTAPGKKTPLEVASERHAARTPETVADIQRRWNERKKLNETIAALSEELRRHGTLEGSQDMDEHEVMQLWWELNDDQRLRVLREGQFTGMILNEGDLSFASLYRPTTKQLMVETVQDELENVRAGYDMTDTNHYVIKLKGKAPIYSEELTKPLTKSQIENIEWISASEGMSNYRYWTANADCVADMRLHMGFIEYEDGIVVKSHELRESPKIEKGLNTARKSLIRQNREVMLILDKNGKPIQSVSGVARAVHFDDETAALVKDRVVTHNHPSGKNATGVQSFGYSLSLEDLIEAFKCDMRGMVAESPMYRYAIERPNNGWNIDVKKFRSDYEKISDEIIAHYTDILDRHNAANFVQHLVLKKLAKQYGFVYRYTRL